MVKKTQIKIKPWYYELEWSQLQMTIIVWVLSLLIAIGAIFGAYFYLFELQTWNKQKQSDLGQVRYQYSTRHEVLNMIQSKEFALFKVMKERDFYVESGQKQNVSELKLDIQGQAFEIKKQINAFVKEKAVSFKENLIVDSPQNYKDIFLNLDPSYHVYWVAISLEMGLLHEVDLFDLSNIFLQQIKTGLLNIRSCEITRMKNDIDNTNVTDPNIKVMCTMHWYTSRIHEPIEEQGI